MHYYDHLQLYFALYIMKIDQEHLALYSFSILVQYNFSIIHLQFQYNIHSKESKYLQLLWFWNLSGGQERTPISRDATRTTGEFIDGKY